MKIRFKRPMDKEARDTIVGGIVLFAILMLLVALSHAM